MAILKSSLVLIVFCFTIISSNVLPKKPTNSPIPTEENSEEVDIEGRILNGLIAKETTFPFMVSLQEKDEDGSIKFCGGVIIRPKLILTAAHCFEDIEDPEKFNNDFRVKAGVLEAYSHGPTSQSVRVRKIMLHPRYDTITADNDIALLLLEQPLKYNKHVRPIALPPKNYMAKGNGTIIGWGTIDKAEEIDSKVLRYATLPVSKRRHCRDRFENITMNQLCLGYKTIQNACAGDSGGPYVQTINGKPAVVGITSYGTTGCNENDPIVYTNVASYLKFIKDTLVANLDKNIIISKALSDTNFKTVMEYPFLAAIMELNAEDGTLEKICTAVIIDVQFVLTTADCFDNREGSYRQYIRVKVGTAEIDNPIKGELFEVEKIRRHPLYSISDLTMKNNLAVLKLKTPLKLSENVAKAFLPPVYYGLESIEGKIIGWDVNNTTQSNNLILSNVRNGNVRNCKQLYPNATDSEICVERTNDVCNLDAGSPLIVKSKNGNFVIGLNSIFETKCENNQPFLVANILHYISFIENVFNNV